MAEDLVPENGFPGMPQCSASSSLPPPPRGVRGAPAWLPGGPTSQLQRGMPLPLSIVGGQETRLVFSVWKQNQDSVFNREQLPQTNPPQRGPGAPTWGAAGCRELCASVSDAGGGLNRGGVGQLPPTAARAPPTSPGRVVGTQGDSTAQG